MGNENKFFEAMERDIMNADISETDRSKLLRNIP